MVDQLVALNRNYALVYIGLTLIYGIILPHYDIYHYESALLYLEKRITNRLFLVLFFIFFLFMCNLELLMVMSG